MELGGLRLSLHTRQIVKPSLLENNEFALETGLDLMAREAAKDSFYTDLLVLQFLPVNPEAQVQL